MKQRKTFSFRKPSDWNSGYKFHLEAHGAGLQIQRESRYRNISKKSLPILHEETSWLDAYMTANGRWYWLDNKQRVWRMDQRLHDIDLVMELPKHESYEPLRIAAHGDYLFVLSRSLANTNTSSEDASKSSSIHCYLLESGQLKWQAETWKLDSFNAVSLYAHENGTLIALGWIGNEKAVNLLQFDEVGLPLQQAELPSYCKSRLEEACIGGKWDSWNRLSGNKKQEIIVIDGSNHKLISWNLLDSPVYTDLPAAVVAENVTAYTVDYSGQYWLLVEHQQSEQCELICMDSNGAIKERGNIPATASDYLLARGKSLQIINIAKNEAYLLEPKLLPSFWPALNGYKGIWISGALDSGTLDTQWHRFELDISLQHDTAVNVRYYASDTIKSDINSQSIDNILNDTQLTDEEKLTKLEPLWQHTLYDPQDALFVNAKGRYLWISIELIGVDTHSPIINGLEVYFPRDSLVNDLPVVYQRSDNGFLTNYLSIFQTMLEESDRMIQEAPRRLEASQSTGASLRWLTNWLGIEADDYWSEEQLRELLTVAPKLYSLRGTKYALETLVKIFTGRTPIILEYDDIKPLKENIELSEAVERLYAADPHTFNVLVKADDVNSELKKVTLQHILDRYKPVFTSCKLVVLQPWVYMDLHSYLGMNTILTEPQQLLLDGHTSMPHHTITIDVGQDNQLDKHSRLGLNSRLE